MFMKKKICELLLVMLICILIPNLCMANENIYAEEKNEFEVSDYTYIPEYIGETEKLPKEFSLADKINLRIENQGASNACWAFSLLKSLETNIALENNEKELENFSERHMDYATSRRFLDGINKKSYKKDPGEGGLLVEGLAYLTNGAGAVLEEDMPFEDNSKLIYLNSIDKNTDTIVDDYYMFPIINKEYEYDKNGNTKSIKYLKADKTEYTEKELKQVRNEIKKHIMENGSISAMTAGLKSEYYNNEKIFDSTAYNCNTNNIERDHAFSVIGWDDNYSKYNFANGSRPLKNGAYIVLNSFGEDSFENGILYVSYEDAFIENEMYGIKSSSKIDYDNIYQTDYYGGIYQVGTDNTDEGYYGATFIRETFGTEVINSVGVTLSIYSSLEIYINPVGKDLSLDKLVKVAETSEELEPGYHRIEITPTEIKGNSFAVVIKQKSSSGSFYFEMESPIKNTPYEVVTSDSNSFISVNGNDWRNINSLEIPGVDTNKSDVCIKVFTNYEESKINLAKIGKFKNENNIFSERLTDYHFCYKTMDYWKKTKNLSNYVGSTL